MVVRGLLWRSMMVTWRSMVRDRPMGRMMVRGLLWRGLPGRRMMSNRLSMLVRDLLWRSMVM